MATFLVTIVFILSTLTRLRVCAVSETVWERAHSAVKSLGDDAHSYLVSLFGNQAVDKLLKTIGDGVKETSQAAAHVLNSVTGYITELLAAAEIDVNLQKFLTPQGMVFVAKWAVVVIPGYWLLSRTLWLVAAVIGAVIKLALLPLKCIFAIGRAFNKFKGLAKQMKQIKLKKKQK